MFRLLDSNEEDVEWAEFLNVWWESVQGQPVTSAGLYQVAISRKLLLSFWSGRSQHGGKTAFGKELRKRRDRVIDGYRIKSAGQDTHSRTPRYRLERVNENAGVAGVSVASSRTEKINSADVGTPLPDEEQAVPTPAQNLDGEISPAKPSKPSDEPVQRQWDLL